MPRVLYSAVIFAVLFSYTPFVVYAQTFTLSPFESSLFRVFCTFARSAECNTASVIQALPSQRRVVQNTNEATGTRAQGIDEATGTRAQAVETKPTIIQQITNPVVERIIETKEVVRESGLTQEQFDIALNELRKELYKVQASPANEYSNNIWRAISLTNKIDSLTGTTITNPSITGGTISNTPISGSTGSFTSLSTSGDLTVTGTTTTGNLVITGALTTPFSAGSIPFANSTGVLTQDNSNLFWDDTNNRLGILDASPASAFSVGSGDLFQVNSSGAIAAATGITSSGTINFSGLSASSLVFTDASKNLASSAASSVFASSVTDETGSGALVFATSPTLTTPTISGNLTMTGHILPSADDTYDLGSASARWRDLYLGGDTIHLGTSATDEATFGYNTTTNILNIGTDSTTNGDIAFFTDDLYLDKSTGNVGIGTTSPISKLAVSGRTSSIDAASPWGGLFGGWGGAQTVALGNYNGVATIQGASDSNASQVANLAINSIGGNVGIGTTSPGTKLEVSLPSSNDGGTNSIRISNPASSVSSRVDLIAGNLDNDNPYFAITTRENNSPYAQVERLRITDTGNVGIGTTSPISKLAVSGRTGSIDAASPWGGLFGGWGGAQTVALGNYNGVATIQGASDSNASQVANLAINSIGGNVGIGTTSPGTKLEVSLPSSNDGGTNSIRISNPASSVSSRVDLIAGNLDNDNPYFAITTRENNSPYAQVERLRITDTGNVGIGTTSPVAKLSVLGESALAGGASVGLGYAGTAAPTGGMIIQGNVGIGTTAPSYKFEVSGDTNVARFNSSSANLDLVLNSTGSDLSFYTGAYGRIYTTTNHPLHLGANSGIKLSILSDGNIGIGEQSPGARLSVSGGMAVGSSYDTTTVADGDAIISGNVGIGTTNPTEKLTVYNGSTTGTYTTSGWAHSSDARLKTNVATISEALDTIDRLEGVTFNWTTDPDAHQQIGFIAQDVKEVPPQVVVGDDTTGYGIAYGNITALLTNGVKELWHTVRDVISQLTDHERRIEALEAEIADLRAQMGTQGSQEGGGASTPQPTSEVYETPGGQSEEAAPSENTSSEPGEQSAVESVPEQTSEEESPAEVTEQSTEDGSVITEVSTSEVESPPVEPGDTLVESTE